MLIFSKVRMKSNCKKDNILIDRNIFTSAKFLVKHEKVAFDGTIQRQKKMSNISNDKLNSLG